MQKQPHSRAKGHLFEELTTHELRVNLNLKIWQGHPPGAINVQVYRLIKEWTAWDIARRAAFAFFGIFSGTEENPNFIQGKNEKDTG